MGDNPEYKGEWKPRQLDNPDYVEDVYAFDDIGAVGFELWTVNKGPVFDNILICDSFEYAKKEGESLKKIFENEKDAKKAWEKATGKDKKDSGSSAGDDEDADDEDEAEDSVDRAKEDL